MKRTLIMRMLLVAGVGMIATAGLAAQLGLDRNLEWGTGRRAVLAIGIGLLLVAALVDQGPRILNAVPPSARLALRGFFQNRFFAFVWGHRFGILLGAGTVLIAVAYVFFASRGTWTNWPEQTHLYDDLAEGFLDGHLYVKVQPSAEFLALPDPYDPAARVQTPELSKFVDSVYDLSYYNGKFYVYWPPLPAVLAAGARLLFAQPLGDQHLVFGFLVGVLAFTALLITSLWRRFYADVPFSLALIGIGAAALAWPIPALLSNANMYEASIAAGQCFLIGGLYFASLGLDGRQPSQSHLIIAAAMWALAAASRTLVLLPAALLTLMMMLVLWARRGTARSLFHQAATVLTLALPLTIVVLVLGWYNLARFGSMLDPGYRYALSYENLNRPDYQGFSTVYAVPNLWRYILKPFETQARFPFVVATVDGHPAFPYLGRVGDYHVERTTGILFAAPFALFAILAAVAALRSIGRLRRPLPGNSGREQFPVWTWISLTVAAAVSAAAVLGYSDVRLRYLAEFVPALMLLAVLGVFQGYRWLQGSTLVRRLYIVGVFVVALASTLLGSLLSLAENYNKFRQHNPQLLKQLIQLFNGG
jgi:hypothetical protein